MDLSLIWLLYGGIGLVAGVLAGLLGVGGGIVIVPALTFAYHALGMPEHYIMHLALGTSLGTIMFTSISSVRAHHKRGAVIWAIVLTIAPGIVLGTYAGSWLAAYLSSRFLGFFFCAFLYLVSVQMLLKFRPKPSRQMPGLGGMVAAGGVIGAVSSLVGIGGGTMSVPFMIWCNTPPHKAVATSAGIGFPIAVAGTLGYISAGWGSPGLPANCLGFVHLPSLIGVAVGSMLTAPLGAKLAHLLPAEKLKRGFGVFIILVATRMLWKLL